MCICTYVCTFVCLKVLVTDTSVFLCTYVQNGGVAGAGAEGLAAMAKLMSSRQRVGQNGEYTTRAVQQMQT